jgi:hypothetical protein
MKKRLIGIVIGVVLLAGVVCGETYLFTPSIGKRKMKVVRKYAVIVLPSQTNIVEIPAMFGFAGVTNEQAIESSVFTFSVPPDKTEVKCREYDGIWSKKTYRLTWTKPAAITVTMTQESIVTLTARNKLCTQAKLPYSIQVHEKFKYYLEKTEDGEINPDHPALASVCSGILQKSRYAEEAVSLVCDWVADNIEWCKGEGWGVDKALETHTGNSYALSCTACSMLRKMGIPCDVVYGTYVEGSSYYYIEAYFSDAGWVFYDLACPERGFKSLDCVAAAGKDYCVQNEAKKEFEWTRGVYFDSWDISKYVQPEPMRKKALRDTPAKKEALSVMVAHVPVPTNLPVRWEPLRNLILDPNIQPPAVVEKKTAEKDSAFDGDKPKQKSGKGKE